MRRNDLFTMLYTVPPLTLNCLSLNEPTLKLIWSSTCNLSYALSRSPVTEYRGNINGTRVSSKYLYKLSVDITLMEKKYCTQCILRNKIDSIYLLLAKENELNCITLRWWKAVKEIFLYILLLSEFQIIFCHVHLHPIWLILAVIIRHPPPNNIWQNPF